MNGRRERGTDASLLSALRARKLSLRVVTLPDFVSLGSSSLRIQIQILPVKLMKVYIRETHVISFIAG